MRTAGAAADRRDRAQRWPLLFGACAVAWFVGLAAVYWPPGVDYYTIYQPMADRLVAGTTQLYIVGTRYYDAPWLLAILVPLTRLPPNIGQAVLDTLSVLMALGAVHLLRTEQRIPTIGVVLGLANLHTFSLIFRGQVDAFVLLGVVLGWFAIRRERPWLLAAALLLMAIKPQNVLLVALLYFFAIRHWSVRAKLRSVSLVALSILAADVTIGPDWPWRYIAYVRESPPGLLVYATTLWRGASYLDLPQWPVALMAAAAGIALIWWVKRDGFSTAALSLALATNFAFSAYVLGYHDIILLPALLYVARYNWRLACVAYLFTFTPLLRIEYGFGISWVDAGYPLALLFACWYVALRTARSQTPNAVESLSPAEIDRVVPAAAAQA
jgi:hypothetical protein